MTRVEAMLDDRHCTNCRSKLPRGASACPQCGVFAGDVFDGRIRKVRRTGTLRNWLPLILVLAAVAGGVFAWRQRTSPERMPEPQPVRIVNRPAGARRAPGATLSEPEAIRTLRGHLTTRERTSECIVISSQGARAGAYRLTALDRCSGTRLGRFAVNADSGEVSTGQR